MLVCSPLTQTLESSHSIFSLMIQPLGLDFPSTSHTSYISVQLELIYLQLLWNKCYIHCTAWSPHFCMTLAHPVPWVHMSMRTLPYGEYIGDNQELPHPVRNFWVFYPCHSSLSWSKSSGVFSAKSHSLVLQHILPVISQNSNLNSAEVCSHIIKFPTQ